MLEKWLGKSVAIGLAWAAFQCVAWPLSSPLEMATIYKNEVAWRLEVPPAEALQYGHLVDQALAQAGVLGPLDEYLVVVDRSPQIQAVFLYWKTTGAPPVFIGASPASTGRPGRFDYFETPVGVFEHVTDNLDFRAEGTLNENGIRGYGDKGMRVFDFGWQQAQRGWGDRRVSAMRLQMHATDPDFLESRLGSAQSKGCIRIPATLNHLLDHYGVLDALYERRLAAGEMLWMLPPGRQATPWSGRYLVVVDSQRTVRPPWAVPPPFPKRPPPLR